MPSGPGVIAEELIADIVSSVPPRVSTFLLTSLRDVDGIVAQQRRTGVTTLQLCDRLARDDYARLREALPGTRLIQVIHVTGAEVIEDARSVAPLVDAILLDTGHPTAPVKVLGGTGRTHDWAISRQIRDLVGVPIYLAGGLRPDNVAEAIRRVRPAAIDVCSGVRTEGRLDPDKLDRFFDAARMARW